MSKNLHINRLFKKLICCVALSVFTANTVLPVAIAQTILDLPAPGKMLSFSPIYVAPNVKGIKLYPENPLRFDFIIDSGDGSLDEKSLSVEAEKMAKYFLAAITIPGDDMWVNLSPYENDRIVTPSFGVTEMGKDLLAQDYVLKQITASMMFPEGKLGEKFWKRVYEKAYAQFGTTNIPVNSFNKVWIIPDHATVYTQTDTAMVVESRLKVMLDSDYTALKQNMNKGSLGTDQMNMKDTTSVNDVTSQIVREIMIPELEKEVNEGENFAKLRQIYNAIILATWYKKNLRENILNKVYVSKNKTAGIDVDDKNIKDKIYDQYLQAFKKGVYDVVKEEFDPASQEIIPRRYFSGGALFTPETIERSVAFVQNDQSLANRSITSDNHGKDFIAQFDLTTSDKNLPSTNRSTALPLIDDFKTIPSDYSMTELMLQKYAQSIHVPPEAVLRQYNGKTIVLVGINTSLLPQKLHESLPQAKIFVINPDTRQLEYKPDAYTIVNQEMEDVLPSQIPPADLIISINMLNEEYVGNVIAPRRYQKNVGNAYQVILNKFSTLLSAQGQILISQGLFKNSWLEKAAANANLDVRDLKKPSPELATAPIYLLSKHSFDATRQSSDRSITVVSLDDATFPSKLNTTQIDGSSYFQLADQHITLTSENLERYTIEQPLVIHVGKKWKEGGTTTVTVSLHDKKLHLAGEFIPADGSTMIDFPASNVELPTVEGEVKRIIIGRQSSTPEILPQNTQRFDLFTTNKTISRKHLEVILEKTNGVVTVSLKNYTENPDDKPTNLATYLAQDRLLSLVDKFMTVHKSLDVFAPNVYEVLAPVITPENGPKLLQIKPKDTLSIPVENLQLNSPLVLSLGNNYVFNEIVGIENGGVRIYDGRRNDATSYVDLVPPEDGNVKRITVGRDPSRGDEKDADPFKLSGVNANVSKSQYRLSIERHNGENVVTLEDISTTNSTFISEESLKQIRAVQRYKDLLKKDNATQATVFAQRGGREHQEDRFISTRINIPFISHGKGNLYAVMDGHGIQPKGQPINPNFGASVAEYIKNHFPDIFRTALLTKNGDVLKAIPIAIERIQQDTSNQDAGSTLSFLYIPDDELKSYWAVIGDSPLAATQRDGTPFIAPLHNVSNDAEIALAREKGIVLLGFRMSLTRSIGDKDLKNNLISEPDFGVFDIGPNSHFLLMSDGASVRPEHRQIPGGIPRYNARIKVVEDLIQKFSNDEITNAQQIVALADPQNDNALVLAVHVDPHHAQLDSNLTDVAQILKFPPEKMKDLLLSIILQAENNPVLSQMDIYGIVSEIDTTLKNIQKKNMERVKNEIGQLSSLQKAFLRLHSTVDDLARHTIDEARAYHRGSVIRRATEIIPKNQTIFNTVIEKGLYLELSVQERLAQIQRAEEVNVKVTASGIENPYSQERELLSTIAKLIVLAENAESQTLRSQSQSRAEPSTTPHQNNNRSLAIDTSIIIQTLPARAKTFQQIIDENIDDGIKTVTFDAYQSEAFSKLLNKLIEQKIALSSLKPENLVFVPTSSIGHEVQAYLWNKNIDDKIDTSASPTALTETYLNFVNTYFQDYDTSGEIRYYLKRKLAGREANQRPAPVASNSQSTRLASQPVKGERSVAVTQPQRLVPTVIHPATDSEIQLAFNDIQQWIDKNRKFTVEQKSQASADLITKRKNPDFTNLVGIARRKNIIIINALSTWQAATYKELTEIINALPKSFTDLSSPITFDIDKNFDFSYRYHVIPESFAQRIISEIVLALVTQKNTTNQPFLTEENWREIGNVINNDNDWLPEPNNANFYDVMASSTIPQITRLKRAVALAVANIQNPTILAHESFDESTIEKVRDILSDSPFFNDTSKIQTKTDPETHQSAIFSTLNEFDGTAWTTADKLVTETIPSSEKRRDSGYPVLNATFELSLYSGLRHFDVELRREEIVEGVLFDQFPFRFEIDPTTKTPTLIIIKKTFDGKTLEEKHTLEYSGQDEFLKVSLTHDNVLDFNTHDKDADFVNFISNTTRNFQIFQSETSHTTLTVRKKIQPLISLGKNQETRPLPLNENSYLVSLNGFPVKVKMSGDNPIVEVPQYLMSIFGKIVSSEVHFPESKAGEEVTSQVILGKSAEPVTGTTVIEVNSYKNSDEDLLPAFLKDEWLPRPRSNTTIADQHTQLTFTKKSTGEIFVTVKDLTGWGTTVQYKTDPEELLRVEQEIRNAIARDFEKGHLSQEAKNNAEQFVDQVRDNPFLSQLVVLARKKNILFYSSNPKLLDAEQGAGIVQSFIRTFNDLPASILKKSNIPLTLDVAQSKELGTQILGQARVAQQGKMELALTRANQLNMTRSTLVHEIGHLLSVALDFQGNLVLRPEDWRDISKIVNAGVNIYPEESKFKTDREFRDEVAKRYNTSQEIQVNEAIAMALENRADVEYLTSLHGKTFKITLEMIKQVRQVLERNLLLDTSTAKLNPNNPQEETVTGYRFTGEKWETYSMTRPVSSRAVDVTAEENTFPDSQPAVSERSIAQSKDVGGIDVNPDLIKMKTEGSQINLNVTDQLRNLEKMPFDGFKPNLIQLVPANLPAFLGLQTTTPATQLSSVK